ncbi:MAG: hypothetical protein M1320_01605 [Patescibacteria group bacterium]|nr:hypothetical protein [Patescibacteria group bacterium]
MGEVKTGIVAFAFGAPDSIKSNVQIAQITMAVSRSSRELNFPIYTQKDIGIFGLQFQIQYINEQPGNPLTTLRIARGAVQWAKEKGLNQLLVVAAEPHLWRALRDTKKAVGELGLWVEVWPCKNEIKQYSYGSWFCLDSKKGWTRSMKEYSRRENILCLLPFFIYKRIAC